MKFLDEAKVYIQAGNGGSGCTSFRHEKFIEFGGPDGGNGGNGGDVYVQATNNVNTLIDYRYKQHFYAEDGKPGGKRNKTGRSGKDLTLIVPIGTQVLDEDKSTVIADLVYEHQVEKLLSGGIGGLGNTHFKSSTNRAPRYHQIGTPGEKKWIWLKLKLIADIGIIGLPNAGKSTLFSFITNSVAKIASYSFTTTIPQLGIINNSKLVIADIPGLIKNAHLGKGLGERFLAHIERCNLLIHVIDAADNAVRNYQIIRNELHKYSAYVANKPELIVLNKIDINSSFLDEKQSLEKITGNKIICISALNKIGREELIKSLLDYFNCTN